MSAPTRATQLTREMRDRLRAIADALIPAAHGMPAAGDVGVSEGQLDRVLKARPDLVEPFVRALGKPEEGDADALLTHLEGDDPAAHEALLMAVVGGYYIHPQVRDRLGYDGQTAAVVSPEITPNYVEEGLIEPVLQRGPIYRPVANEKEESS